MLGGPLYALGPIFHQVCIVPVVEVTPDDLEIVPVSLQPVGKPETMHIFSLLFIILFHKRQYRHEPLLTSDGHGLCGTAFIWKDS